MRWSRLDSNDFRSLALKSSADMNAAFLNRRGVPISCRRRTGVA
jgi:hypothetical protein